MDVLRLVLVDDYRMVTEALASRLSSAPDLWVAGCSQTDDPRLPEIIRWLRPDIVLIDVEPLGFAVAEVLGRIRTAWPQARIIVVSADDDVSHAVDAARAGADAWVSKNQGADQLETVLRGVARGHSWFPPEMLGEVLRGLREDVREARESTNLLDTLSPRELDVLTSMAKGKRARQIAAELMISADTVRTHTRSIFGKLEVHSRIEAVSVAWAAGLRPAEAQPPPGGRAAGADDERPAGRAPSGKPRVVKSGPDRPGGARPGTPGAGRSGSGRSGPARPGRSDAGPDKPRAVRPGADRPHPVQSGPVQPGQRQPRPVQPGPGQPGPGQPGPGQSGPAQPAVRRSAGQPDPAQRPAGRPAAGRPGSLPPGAARHRPAEPGSPRRGPVTADLDSRASGGPPRAAGSGGP
jgi:two-component system, NarL family, response regulator LiaR